MSAVVHSVVSDMSDPVEKQGKMSCIRCRSAKKKCEGHSNGSVPCSRCVKLGIGHLCHFIPRRRRRTKAEIKEDMKKTLVDDEQSLYEKCDEADACARDVMLGVLYPEVRDKYASAWLVIPEDEEVRNTQPQTSPLLNVSEEEEAFASLLLDNVTTDSFSSAPSVEMAMSELLKVLSSPSSQDVKLHVFSLKDVSWIDKVRCAAMSTDIVISSVLNPSEQLKQLNEKLVQLKFHEGLVPAVVFDGRGHPVWTQFSLFTFQEQLSSAIVVNKPFTSLTGYSQEDVGMNLLFVHNLICSQSRMGMFGKCVRGFIIKQSYTHSMRIRTRYSDDWVWVVSRNVIIVDDLGAPCFLVSYMLPFEAEDTSATDESASI